MANDRVRSPSQVTLLINFTTWRLGDASWRVNESGFSVNRAVYRISCENKQIGARAIVHDSTDQWTGSRNNGASFRAPAYK